MGGNDGPAVAGAEVDGIHGTESVRDKAEAGDQAAGRLVGRGVGGDAVDGDGGFAVFHGEP